jgi:hypothetical protein
MEEPTVGQRTVVSQSERDRNAQKLLAEAYQHLIHHSDHCPNEKIDLAPIINPLSMELTK